MLCDEESQIASYEVAVEACLVDLEGKALPEIYPVTVQMLKTWALGAI